MRRKLAALIVLIVPALTLAIDVDNPPMGVFADEWYAVMMQGAKSGHMHNTMERVKKDGRDFIRTRSEMSMVAGRGSVQITVNVTEGTEETLDGKPIRFTSKQSMAKYPTSTEGTFANGKVTIVHRQLFIPTDSVTYTLPEGAKMSWGLYREQLANGLKPGSKFELSMYEPSMAPDQLIKATVEVLEREKVDLFGRKVDAIKSKETMHLPGAGGGMAISTLTWMNDEGDALKLRMSLMGFDIDLISCSKPVALAKNNPADIMTGTFIQADKPIDPDAKTLTLRLEWAQDRPTMPATGMQKVIGQENNSVTVTNTRYSARPKTGGEPLSAEDHERFLAATQLLNHKDSEVARLAKKAAGNEKDPYKLACKLREFVSEYVKSKNLNVGFGSASEVARSKEGDCSEHGVLLAAMGRALGLPTRIATGYVHTDEFLGKDNVFVGHLWTQFFIEGQWVDIDAALQEDDVDPTHIAFAISDGGSNGIADLIGSAWMGAKPKITVIEP